MKRKLSSLMTLVAGGILILGLLVPSGTSASVPGVNEAVDVSDSGGNPNGSAGGATMSQDGRFIAFASTATNLVSPATNGKNQVFVRDRLEHTTTLVSLSSSGVEGNSDSISPRISADGRYIVFESYASNLVSGDTNGQIDIFIHDMSTGTTQIVSANSSGVEGNNASQDPDVNADGTYVVFDSYTTNLVPSPTVSGNNIYIKNMVSGGVQLLSQSATGNDANAASWYPKISCEGRFVAFQSNATNLVTGDTNTNKNITRIYLVDMLKPTEPLYIKSDPDGTGMADPSISCNGNYISFTSSSSNIVANDTNGLSDAFVYDRINNTFDRISVGSDGTQGNASVGGFPNVSNDGKYAVFDSGATNLVSGVPSGANEVYIHNRQSGTTEIITQNSGGTISSVGGAGEYISSDGRYVTYQSSASDLVNGFAADSGNAIYASQTGASDDY